MHAQSYSKEWETKQYKNQTNIVYFGSLIGTSVLLIIILFTKEMVFFSINLWTLLVTIISIYLNQKGRYALASLLFIASISIIAAFEVIYLGFEAGFFYYAFNMSTLIIFTKWKNRQKQVRVVVLFLLFSSAGLYAFLNGPMVVLESGWLIFFHLINVGLNIVGVANSTTFYVKTSIDAHKKLTEFATMDYLTKLPNRTSFIYKFEDTIKKNVTGIGFLMIDTDDFKVINDTYGHLTGDSILEKIGKVFNDYKKVNHYPARYGGEEFVYLIETNDRQEVYRVSEHLRKAMKDLGKKNNVNLSISIGCVFKSINSTENFNVITLADQLLYQAKREGKDKVIFKSF